MYAELLEWLQMQADYIFFHPGLRSPQITRSLTQPLDRRHIHKSMEQLETKGPGGASVSVCDVARRLSIRPSKSLLLPKHLSADRWPRSEFVMSDHRPLLGIFQVERHAMLSN